MSGLLHRLTISASLRLAFVFSAILTLFVSIVSLYSWNVQNTQVRYALDDYFPKIQASFQFEENLTSLVNEFNELQQSTNTSSRLQLREQIKLRLQKIQTISPHLDQERQSTLHQQVNASYQLLNNLDSTLYNSYLEKEKLNEISSRINWLHDDFSNELSSLSQDLSWQQSSLLEQLSQTSSAEKSQALQQSLRNVQNELQLVFALSHTEVQIVEALREMLKADYRDESNLVSHINYLNYLKQLTDDGALALEKHTSTVTLRQTVYSLLELGISKNYLPGALADNQHAQQMLQKTVGEKEILLTQLRSQLEKQLGNSHLQLQTFNHKLENIMQISGMLIVAAMLTALLFVVLLNYLFIRPRMTNRFKALNDAVARLSNGELDAEIPLSGNDELGRIANLLRQTIVQINQQKHQLEQEIGERIVIENNLRTAQDELIQTAKLAVVGQTMTTLAHEVNQPLNALSMYLHSIGRALEQRNTQAVTNYLLTMRSLIERMDNIIKRLRYFARRRDGDQSLGELDLRQVIESSWELLALRHRPLQAKMTYPEHIHPIFGDDVRIQQVLVNILTNALEAVSGLPPQITIEQQEDDKSVTLYVYDNGKGWSLDLADKLLTPFTTDKSVGLGIGLSISRSIMHQCQGELFIASSLDHHALVILQFRKP
ncbi:Phosphoglycerate transport system sensor protein pgtB [Pragia fontium]|uniref:histidine kinase n=2 Tax=Pragia fontium TaxID=82985 RepID=A0AAJ4W9X0_9GAMM|nr:ATP-binding protein [Pragia fontium]GKX63461.1 two-component sensor histidine kinase [Pragia fontium]SFC64978.1 two-component system, NtrC family, phosphoglycerate transport system sensor histidine kinase PgtB [Pragia fontium DSM 5563 = ATCC 49100]SUB83599.1 Phosphoglycerate transport system sensor protein pgtB [Pragia fontium]